MKEKKETTRNLPSLLGLTVVDEWGDKDESKDWNCPFCGRKMEVAKKGNGDMPEVNRKPEEWLKTPEFEGITILDPDGWDRQDFDKSWNERITKKEMWKRTMYSTVQTR